MSIRIALIVLTLATVAQAVLIPAEKEHVISLDGTWRFRLEPAAVAPQRYHRELPKTIATTEPSEAFYTENFHEGDDWKDLTVPGNWEMAGFSPATYWQPDDTSGEYRLSFDVPANWEGRVVRVNFDGVQNGAQVWLNGQPVKVDEPSWGRKNYHESGWTAWQADLTPAVKFGAKNLLALRVSKSTRSADLDSGDFYFLGGIYRPVTLFCVPNAHIRDLTITTKLKDGGGAEVNVDADIAGGRDAVGVTVRSRLEGADTVAARPGGTTHAIATHVLEKPRLWSAEDPNLYALTIELRDRDGQTIERITRRVGVREVTIKDGVLLLNRQPIKLAGICRHDVFATKGTAVDEEVWRKDLDLMRQANINCVRTSHYPYGSGFYDLCDEMGFYVVDELPYCWCNTSDPKLFPAYLQRARETVARDKNHASVIIWGVGNENKPGEANQRVADYLKETDATRPREVSQFPFDKYATELSDSHYTAPPEIEKAAQHAKETGHPQVYCENPNVWDVRLGADPGCTDRWVEVIRRTWDVCASSDTIVGTCIWEWQDRAVADKSPTKLYELDPATGINYLKIKGIVDANRHPRAELWNLKMVYSPIQVQPKLDESSTPTAAVLDVTNRYSFTDLSTIEMAWTLLKGDTSDNQVAAGTTHAALAPRTSGKVKIDLPASAADADTLRVAFNHPTKGNVTTVQFALKEIPAPPLAPAPPAELAFPRFNLVINNTHSDKEKWRVCERKTGKLINVKQDAGSLHGDVALGDEPAVVAHVKATLANGEFSYRLDWSGAKSDVQELGWTLAMPAKFDHFSWKRHATWSYYPDTHIGRARGTATPQSLADVHLTDYSKPDAFDFISTKYDCDWAALTDASGANGVAVAFAPDQRQHVKAAVLNSAGGGTAGYGLVVNRQCSPPRDISSSVVPDLYMELKAGDHVDGHFRIGGVVGK